MYSICCGAIPPIRPTGSRMTGRIKPMTTGTSARLDCSRITGLVIRSRLVSSPSLACQRLFKAQTPVVLQRREGPLLVGNAEREDERRRAVGRRREGRRHVLPEAGQQRAVVGEPSPLHAWPDKPREERARGPRRRRGRIVQREFPLLGEVGAPLHDPPERSGRTRSRREPLQMSGGGRSDAAWRSPSTPQCS